ncbi:MAG: choice-of-anchor J domain-containing protein [Muribaculaceae bacterium]|nr:choice-of-anchor J domain-containing protein [Muribaculaceae bacterium]
MKIFSTLALLSLCLLTSLFIALPADKIPIGHNSKPKKAQVSSSDSHFWDNPYTEPAEGKVSRLEDITVKFPNNEDGDLDDGIYNKTYVIIENLTTGEETTTPTGCVQAYWYYGKIRLPEAITAPGSYKVTVPEGAWTCYYDDSDSPEMSFSFTISGGEEPEISHFWDDPYTEPAEGKVSKLDEISVYFPNNEDGDLDDGVYSQTYVTVKNLTTGEEITTPTGCVSANWNYGKIVLPEPITTPGSYKITVPEKAWTCWTDDSESPEISFSYTIEGGGEIAVNHFESSVVTPAPGNVSELEEIKISFPNATDKPIVTNSIFWAYISLNGERTEKFDINDDNAVILKFAKITEPGEYTLNIPENSFRYGDDELSPLMEFKYTIVEDNEETLVPPFNMALNSETFPLHTVIDANNDGNTIRLKYGEVQYECNYTNADDWLISPAIALEADKSYQFKVNLNHFYLYNETVEVKYGTAPTVEAMTNTALEETIISNGKDTDYEGLIISKDAGKYYIGIHVKSDHNAYILNINGYSLGNPMTALSPEAVTDAAVTPDFNKGLSAEISFTAPTHTTSGRDITDKITIDITRNDDNIKTLSVDPGEKVSFTDIVSVAGECTYTFTPSIDGTSGPSVSVINFIGPTQPAHPKNIHGYQDCETDEIVLMWEAPTEDRYGNPIDPDKVEYNIWTIAGPYIDEKMNDKPITGNQYRFRYTPEEQDFIQFVLEASYLGAESAGVTSSLIAVGAPYKLPVQLSKSADLAAHAFSIEGQDADVNFVALEPEYSQDGDGEVICVEFKTPEGSLDLLSGRIDFDTKNPTLLFYAEKQLMFDNNMIDVYSLQNGEETLIKTVEMKDLSEEGWERVSVDLSSVKGVGQIGLRFRCGGMMPKMYVDNIIFVNEVRKDLSVELSTPVLVETSVEFNADIIVHNRGTEDSDSFTVTLLNDDKVIGTSEQAPLAVGEYREIAIPAALAPNESALNLCASVNMDGDENTENDKSDIHVIEALINRFAGVSNLSGKFTDDHKVLLTWEGPDANALPRKAVTDDFEDGKSWAQEYNDWTLVDVDKSPCGGFYDLDIPGITYSEDALSYFVFDRAEADDETAERFLMHSGNKCLASLLRWDNAPTDDWAISPLLTGDEQMVSFWVRSFAKNLPESIEFWTSTDSDPRSTYTKNSAFGTRLLSGAWTKFSVLVDEGTRHFAIRSVGSNNFMLMIDDVTYLKDGAGEELPLVGYNVWRDGELITTTPVKDCSYSDDAISTSHKYGVSAVYASGQSNICDEINVTASGVSAIDSNTPSVTTEAGMIIVKAEELPVMIAAADGKLIYTGEGDATVSVESGVYIVSINGKAVKVYVK